jgi:hypothetical protein
MTEETIWVVTSSGQPQIPGPSLPESPSRTSKGFAHSAHQRLGDPLAHPISTDKLEQRMGQFISAMGRVFDQAETQAQTQQRLRLEEIELAVEIGAEGEVRLIGMGGAKTYGRGAITLTFRRSDNHA